MAKNKIKKIVKITNESNDEIKFKQLVIVFILMTLICVGLYFLTDSIILKDQKSSDAESSTSIAEIDPSLILLSAALSQKEKNYYVLIVDFKADYYNDYKTLIDEYNANKKTIKLYKSNLNDGFNEKYNAEKSNPKAKKIDELKVSGPTLLEINEGKIVGYYEGSTKIVPKLK